MQMLKKITVKVVTYLINKIFGVKSDKIIFSSFSGKTYSCNPKSITEEMLNRNSGHNFIWAFKNPKAIDVPKGITKIKIDSFKYFYHLATAKLWINNTTMVNSVFKSKKQIYLNTGHGDRSFKKIYYDSNFKNNKNYYLLEENKCDYILTGSTFGEKMFTSAYNFNGNILKHGSPRNDVLFLDDNDLKYKIKNKLGIRRNSKVLLYAPTYRRDGKKYSEIIDLPEILAMLLDIDSNWVVLIRVHSASNNFDIYNNPKIIDVSNHDDTAEILYITDLLISDYSSIATDFILSKKPVVLYHQDIEEYQEKDRDLYYNVEDTGFNIAYNQKELIRKIEFALKENSADRNNEIKKFYGVYENGDATIRTVDFIYTLLLEKNKFKHFL